MYYKKNERSGKEKKGRGKWKIKQRKTIGYL